MLSLSSSSSFSSFCSSISRQKYDVFLSFRGKDTRKNFVDHLYVALKRNGIITFRDDSRLEASEEIAPKILKAIQESWCTIIIFSETYTFSSWCMDELVEVVEQRRKREHKVFPIFYHVDPSELRNQKGKVKEAFAQHEERYKEYKDKVKRWRIALTEVANIKGWTLSNRHESESIGDIVKTISAKLGQAYPFVSDELIGISSRLKELHSKIGIGEHDVQIIGICGMGGIGKTTFARIVYTQMSPHFEGKSFLADVREVSKKFGLLSLQKQLLSQILLEECFSLFNVHEGSAMISHRLSHKKVLIVIDDVDNRQHLKCLARRRDWFGLGSRIIVTTRDEHLLRSQGVDDVYKPTTLNAEESLHLFNLKAFNSDTVQENVTVELSKQVVEYAAGLPLALEILGSLLCGRDVTQWKSAIERLKRDSNEEILDRLQISFDGLEETEENIFLDIACFFNGVEKDFVTKVFEGCNFFPDIGIDVLTKKSLIKVDEGNKLRMHDLLQEMGRKIVRQKSFIEPGKRCRLWEEKDVYHVLTKNTATDTIEGLSIDNKREHNRTFTLGAEAFSKMKKLRLLKVLYLPNCCHFKYLSDELRLFEWHGYPFKSLPSGFQPDNLIALLLPYSRIEQLWKGNTFLHKLKLVNLRGSQNFVKTPDFTMVPNLERLILEGCTRLVDIHPSIGVLRNLKLLNLKDCKNLKRFPEIDGQMQCLLELYLDGTCMEELPSSIGHLCNLVLLNLKDCKNLASLPSSIDGCKCLKTLTLSGCSKVETLPENLQQVEFLEELDLSGTAIRRPPSFIFQFKNLKVLSFNGCKGPPSKFQSDFLSLFKLLHKRSTNSMALMLPRLSGLSSLTDLSLSNCHLWEGAIPSDICYLSSLEELDLCGNNFIYLPASLSRLSKLRLLTLVDCKWLKSVPELSTSIQGVRIEGCTSLEVVANPEKAFSSSRDIRYVFGTNDGKLSTNSNALTMLNVLSKAFTKAGLFFNFVIPGREIPEWFSHQRDESSINIPLPANNIWNDSQWIGVAFCCVVSDACREDEILSKLHIHGRNSRELDRSTLVFGRNHRHPLFVGEHIWLRYWPRDKLYPFSLEEKCGGTKNLFNTKLDYQDCNDIFETSIQCYGRVKVMKCGVRIVYEKDLEEMEQIKEWSSNATSASFDNHGFTRNGATVVKRKRDIYEDMEQIKEWSSNPTSEGFDNHGLTGNNGGDVAKRKRNIYEEAGLSESDSAEETPKPKRLQKILNLIRGKKH